ncbi:MAG: hypothetical protein ACQEUT_18065 [Bacillota bacterium]
MFAVALAEPEEFKSFGEEMNYRKEWIKRKYAGLPNTPPIRHAMTIDIEDMLTDLIEKWGL